LPSKGGLLTSFVDVYQLEVTACDMSQVDDQGIINAHHFLDKQIFYHQIFMLFTNLVHIHIWQEILLMPESSMWRICIIQVAIAMVVGAM